MKAIFKQLIIDFQQQEIPRPTPRELPSFTLPNQLKKAYVLVGMRRSGKTWSLYQQMHRLLDDGLDRSHLVYLNFEDDRLIGTTLKDMQGILDAYFELFPNLTKSKTLHFFFDEIHEVDGWERFIRRLLDNEAIHLYITGSSAKMLSKEIATSLRGRTLVREIFPYNFREYLSHVGAQYAFEGSISTKQKAILNHYVIQYMARGGFPEVVNVDEPLHHEILQGYIDTVIYRDIIERHGVSNVQTLKRLLSHCLQSPAALFSINKMYHTLKSQGYSVSKNSLYAFMEYFEDAYCLFSIPAFHLSAKKSALKPRKIYPVDPGLITAYAINKEYTQGPALESTVFSALIRSSKRIDYFVTEQGQEVDFFVQLQDESRKLYQVCLSLNDPKTRQRELTALQQAMQATGLVHSSIITLDEEGDIEIPEGRISVIPLWKFLLLG